MWFDNYAGFHNIISNNIISGEVDQSSNHADGNGIILDLNNGSYDYATADTLPCSSSTTSSTAMAADAFTPSSSPTSGSSTTPASKTTWILPNPVSGSFEPNKSGHPLYEQGGTVTNVHYYANLYFGAANNFSYSDPSQFLQADPLFLNPPSLAASGYANALVPSLLSTRLTLLPTSPAFNRGNRSQHPIRTAGQHRQRPQKVHLHRHQRQSSPTRRWCRPRRAYPHELVLTALHEQRKAS